MSSDRSRSAHIRDLTRRQLAVRAGQALGAATLGATVLGCGATATSGESDIGPPVVPKADGDLLLFSFADFFDPAVLKGFERRYGVRVQESNFDSFESMLTRVRAGGEFDLVVPDSPYVEVMVAQNLLRRIDTAKLENFARMDARFRDPPWDRRSRHSVTYSYSTMGIVWNRQRVDGLSGSWRDMLHREAADHVFDFPGTGANIGWANLLSGAGLNAYDETAMDDAHDILLEQKDAVLRGYGFAYDTMPRGTAWINQGFAQDLVTLRVITDNGGDYLYERPREGSPLVVSTLAIPVKARHPGTAALFMDWMLEPDNAIKNSLYAGAPTPVPGTSEALDEVIGDVAAARVTPDLLDDQALLFAPLTGERRKRWDETFTRIQAA